MNASVYTSLRFCVDFFICSRCVNERLTYSSTSLLMFFRLKKYRSAESLLTTMRP